MRSFVINCSTASQQVHSLEEAAKQLTQCSQEISSISSNLGFEIKAKQMIQRRLQELSGNTGTIGSKTAKMSSALEDIVHQYQTAENQIKQNVSGETKDPFLSCDIVWNIMDHIFDILGPGGAIGSVFSSIWKDGTIQFDAKTLGYDAEGNVFANADANQIGVGADGNLEFYGAKAEGEFKDGIFSGKGSMEALTGAVSGAAGCVMLRDGKWDPGLYARVSAEAKGINGTLEGQIGTDAFNTHSSAEGNIGYAKTEAKAGIGYMGKDSSGKDIYGVEAKVGAEAYLAQGEIKSGFTLFGIEVDVGVSGKAGGAGAEAGASWTNHNIDLNGALGLGVGAGFELSIDWTNAKFELPFLKDIKFPNIFGW